MRIARSMGVALLLLQVSGGFCRAEEVPPSESPKETSARQRWQNELKHGEAALAHGEYAEALEHFLAADATTFPESPNYEVLPKIAEARCRLGDRVAGRAILADLSCMLDVDSGVTPCYVGEDTQAAPGHPNPVLTPLCFERMCGEIFLAYYESPSEPQIARVQQLRVELDRVKELCDVETAP